MWSGCEVCVVSAWGLGVFESDAAADWLVEFVEADRASRAVMVRAALAGVRGVEGPGMDECEAAIAAAAVVASRVEGGPECEELAGLGEIGLSVDAGVCGMAADAVSAVMASGSEWTELWAESGELTAKRAGLDRLVAVLRR